MMNKSQLIRFLSVSIAVAGFFLVSGHFASVNAQTRDPFDLPAWRKPKPPVVPGKEKGTKPAAPAVGPVMAPPIESRIAYFKRLREDAAANGQPLPKVTSVLTLEEMVVTGIFRTPRGYAAMVEAKPIKLSYSIYPGEKFFDGQLVAIEENRLVFRKVTKMNNGKFIASVENKALRQYTAEQEIQGTAPVESTAGSSGKTEVAANKAPEAPAVQNGPEQNPNQPVSPASIVSPLDEMNRQPAEKSKDSVKEDAKKNAKKPVKVAKARK